MAVQLPSTPGLFTRQSSGLVRQVGTVDTGLYAVTQIIIGNIVFVISVWPFYAGASMEWSTAITLVGALALGLCYALMSSVYPRSGGEYVFLSRTIHPSVGFVVSFSMAFWLAYYVGIEGALSASLGIAPFIKTLGLQTSSDTLAQVGGWFESSWGLFITSAILVLVITYVVVLGARVYFRVQRWVMVLIFGSVLVTIGVLILGSIGVFDFRANLDSLTGPNSYTNVIGASREAGAELDPAYSFPATVQFLPWPGFALFFGVLSVAFSGEIRNVRRGQLLGISGAMVTAALVMIALEYFGRHAVGQEFMIAASFAESPLPAPYINVMAFITANNAFLTILMGLWVPLTLAWIIGAILIYCSRAILAWSIDGMVPERLGQVSDRYHSPTFAILLTSALGLAGLAIYVFTDLFAVLSGLLGFAIPFLAVALSGLLFPYLRKRHVFESSPAALRIVGLPLLAISGVVASVYGGYLIYRALVDDLVGANGFFSLIMTIGVLVFAVAYFFVVRAYRRREGIDIDRRFQEIPIE